MCVWQDLIEAGVEQQGPAQEAMVEAAVGTGQVGSTSLTCQPLCWGQKDEDGWGWGLGAVEGGGEDWEGSILCAASRGWGIRV